MVTLTSMALLSCNDSDDGIETPAAQVKKAVVTINIKGNTITRALSEEVPGTGNENDIKSLEFFVFNGDGSFQKYFKPEAPAANSQYTFLVDAGNLTILAAVNQNLGEPSTTPISLADFKNTCLYTQLLLNGSNSRADIDASTGFAMAAEGSVNVIESETNILNLSVRRLLSKIENPKVDPNNQITAPKSDLLKVLGLEENGTVPEDLKWSFDGYMKISKGRRVLRLHLTIRQLFPEMEKRSNRYILQRMMRAVKRQTVFCRLIIKSLFSYMKRYLPLCKEETDRQQYSIKMKWWLLSLKGHFQGRV